MTAPEPHTGLSARIDASGAGNAAPVVHLDGPGLFARPDGGLQVAACLSPSWQALSATALAARIAAAYARAPGLWPVLDGVPFAAVIIDRARGLCLAGIDAAGTHQLYYSGGNGNAALCIGSRLAALRAGQGGAPPQVDPQALYDYVYHHCIPSPRTIYQGVGKLPAGHHLRWERGQLEIRRHFAVQFGLDGGELPALSAELKRHLDEAVRGALDPTLRVGAFLSGGLDSSTVSGVLASQLRPVAADTFSIGFDAQGYDEIAYARIAAQRFGTAAHEYYVTPDDVCASVRDLVRAFDEPFGNSSAIPVYFCARLARQHGIQRMLAGDGGDELFAGNYRYAKQLIFERYGRVPAALRAMLEPLVLGSPLGRAPLARKLASYVRQAKIPLPDRLQSYNFLHRHAPTEVFDERLVALIDPQSALRDWRAEYAVHPDADAVDRMLFLDWKFTLHDNDLVKVNSMCALAGVDVAYPMLDEPLLHFSGRVPPALKLKNGELRWFYKQALRDFLPREIIDKKKHGFGLPFGIWLRSHAGLRRIVEESLAALRERRIFRDSFIDSALRLHREDAAGYYGELVWILMALELWLAAEAPATGY